MTGLNDHGTDSVFTNILIGMPNGIISGNGTQSIKEYNNPSSLADSDLSKSITILQNGYEISDKELIESNFKVSIYAIDGKEVKSFENIEIGNFNLKAGVYIIDLSNDKINYSQKFVIE